MRRPSPQLQALILCNEEMREIKAEQGSDLDDIIMSLGETADLGDYDKQALVRISALSLFALSLVVAKEESGQ